LTSILSYHTLYVDLYTEHCNIWRNYGDIQDNWDSVSSIINHYGDNADKFAEVAAPGQFNDPDEVSANIYLL